MFSWTLQISTCDFRGAVWRKSATFRIFLVMLVFDCCWKSDREKSQTAKQEYVVFLLLCQTFCTGRYCQTARHSCCSLPASADNVFLLLICVACGRRAAVEWMPPFQLNLTLEMDSSGVVEVLIFRNHCRHRSQTLFEKDCNTGTWWKIPAEIGQNRVILTSFGMFLESQPIFVIKTMFSKYLDDFQSPNGWQTR